MFDIGFWELAIIGLVALVVVGPERLPKLAYTAGKWMGKGRKMLSQLKSEIDKEMKAEELKQILEEQKKQMNPLEEIVEETTGTLREFANETNKTAQEIEKTEANESEKEEQPVDSPK
jgi:sec-independent protein translocase protein TatB